MYKIYVGWPTGHNQTYGHEGWWYKCVSPSLE